MIDSWWLSNTWLWPLFVCCEFHGKTTPLHVEAFVLQGDWVKCLLLISQGLRWGGWARGRGIDYRRGPGWHSRAFVVVTAACPVVARGMQNECGKMLGVWLWLLSPPLGAVIGRVLVIWRPWRSWSGIQQKDHFNLTPQFGLKKKNMFVTLFVGMRRQKKWRNTKMI